PLLLFSIVVAVDAICLPALSLHDALPISRCGLVKRPVRIPWARRRDSIARLVEVLPFVPATWMIGYDSCGLPASSASRFTGPRRDRKSTRLNSSHVSISYAVFCLQKKNPH